MGRSLIISGHYRRPTGYGGHLREIVRALDNLGIRVQLVDLPTGSLGALPEGKRDPWFDTLNRSVISGTARARLAKDFTWNNRQNVSLKYWKNCTSAMVRSLNRPDRFRRACKTLRLSTAFSLNLS